MKLIINIPEEVYERMKILNEHGMSSDAIKLILNGTPMETECEKCEHASPCIYCKHIFEESEEN